MDNTTKWIKRWNCWVAPTKLLGVWKRKEGGHLVRARVPARQNKLYVSMSRPVRLTLMTPRLPRESALGTRRAQP
jgi:hypothetical protein